MQDEGPDPSPAAFPAVGVRASAGGLEAFIELLHALAVPTGMAFVFIQHLDTHYESQLAEILSRATSMPVVQAEQVPGKRSGDQRRGCRAFRKGLRRRWSPDCDLIVLADMREAPRQETTNILSLSRSQPGM